MEFHCQQPCLVEKECPGVVSCTDVLALVARDAVAVIVCGELEDMMEEGGNIVDYHGCDFFPERWFDSVVVLQTDNSIFSILHDRLTSRGYMGPKLTNNIECEIFQVSLEEAKASYAEDIVMAMRSDDVEDISICEFVVFLSHPVRWVGSVNNF